MPTRSLSQPNGLESCGMTRNDLDDSDSDSVTSHEEGKYIQKLNIQTTVNIFNKTLLLLVSTIAFYFYLFQYQMLKFNLILILFLFYFLFA